MKLNGFAAKAIACGVIVLSSGVLFTYLVRRDAATFLVQSIERNQGQVSDVNVKQLSGFKARVKHDAHGSVLKVFDVPISTIHQILTNAYGVPTLYKPNIHGQLQGVFSVSEAGCAIQYIEREGFVEIIVLKPWTRKR